MKLRRLSLVLVILLVAAFAGACDELMQQDEETDYLAALVGTWVTTSHVVTNNANTSQHVDLYAQGVRLSLVVEADGDLTVIITSDDGTETDTGSIEADASTLTITTASETMTMSYLLVGGILTVTHTGSQYDFNDDGTDEAATEVLVFQHPEDSGDLDLSDLAGSFKATHFVWSDPAGIHESIDLVAHGGFFTLKMTAAGATTVVMAFPGEGGAQVLSGTSTLTSGGDSLFTDFPGTEGDATVGLQVVGTAITLTRSDATYNFGGDTELPALVTITLEPISELSLSTLAGYYSFTSMVLTNPENPGQTYLTGSDDIALTMQIEADGSYTMVNLFRPDEDDITGVEIETATLTVIGNILVMDFTGEDEDTVVQVTVDGSTIELKSVGESYDWDQDGDKDPAVAEITLEAITVGAVGDYAGAWVATGWTYTGEGVGDTFDMIAQKAMATMVVESDGSFQMLMAAPCDSFEIQSGTTALFGDLLMIDMVGELETQYMWQELDGNTWTIRKPDHWNFDELGDDEGAVLEIVLAASTPATMADFTGSWVASHFLLTGLENPSDTYDMITEGGSFTIDIAGDGSMAFSITFPGESAENSTGTVEIFGDMVIITDNSDGWKSVFRYTIGTGTIHLYSNDDCYDFNNDGEDECATLDITLVPPSR